LRLIPQTNFIGWQETRTTSLPNHINFMPIRAKKIDKWRTGLLALKQGRRAEA
jgi:hypothetical protein